jgi:signal transduction histidine kinase
MRDGVLFAIMMSVSVTRVGIATAVYVAAAVVSTAATDLRDAAAEYALLLPSLTLGWLVAVRAPRSPVGPALGLTAAVPAAVFAVEYWGETWWTADPWPGARTVAIVGAGVWAWLFLGFATLILVFPDGLLPGRTWRLVAAAIPVAALLVNTVVSTYPGNFVHQAGETGRVVGGKPPIVAPGLFWNAAGVVAFTLFAATLLAVASSLVVRFRRGDERTRARLRWLMTAALAIPLLLATSWLAEALGLPGTAVYPGMLTAMLVLVPAAIAVAILRHDLFDVDRLFGETLTWLITGAVSAAIFAGVVAGVDTTLPDQDRAGVTGAAFVTALALLPLYHRLHAAVSRLVDRDRVVALAAVKDFVRRVRDGRAEPEQIEAVLRSALQDPELRVLLRRPGGDEYVDLAGVTAMPGPHQIPLHAAGEAAGLLVLGATSARRVRRAQDAAVEARLPIEVSRLRLELREALAEVSASRSRLVTAAAGERLRLERDLHDGAQQQLVAIGMRLRSVQHRLGAGSAAYDDLDEAVDGLERTIGELRRIAHGIRPGRLDDGLAAALRGLVQNSSVPVRLDVAEVDVSEVVATAAYFTVGEAMANALKHAHASQVSVDVRRSGGGLLVEVRDDGVGGARDGFGITSLRDRVASVGGELTVSSPTGAGTSVRAVIPCVS